MFPGCKVAMGLRREPSAQHHSNQLAECPTLTGKPTKVTC